MLLSHVKVDRFDHQVGLRVWLVAERRAAADVSVSDLGVVELRSASASLRLIVEVEEAVAILALRLLVDANESGLDIEAETLDVLE